MKPADTGQRRMQAMSPAYKGQDTECLAKGNKKHQPCHACLPGVVIFLKPSGFNKLDKKCENDEQQLFVYFKTAMERSLDVLNTNDKYLWC